jgi:hypothetical protein
MVLDLAHVRNTCCSLELIAILHSRQLLLFESEFNQYDCFEIFSKTNPLERQRYPRVAAMMAEQVGTSCCLPRSGSVPIGQCGQTGKPTLGP